MTAAALLDRLEKVKQTGPGRWLACCPAHEDRSPSLSIRELDDGRVLLHDFGGCDALTVLNKLGLEMTALFPERLDHHFRPTHSRIPARDLLQLIDREALIVGLCAADILAGKKLSRKSWQRLSKAVARIGRARDASSPAKL